MRRASDLMTILYTGEDTSMDLGIRGKLAVVTGSDSGIGRETAKILAAGWLSCHPE